VQQPDVNSQVAASVHTFLALVVWLPDMEENTNHRFDKPAPSKGQIAELAYTLIRSGHRHHALASAQAG
jgi:hypothetical protein